MKILFIQQDMFVKMGFMYLSAILKEKGHECKILVECLEKDLILKTCSINPDIIAFSCTTGGQDWVIKTARKIKKKIPVITLIGGPHPTFFPEILNEKGIDIISRGESDYALLDLSDTLQKRKDITNIQNLWIKKRIGKKEKVFKNALRSLIDDLDRLPFPDRQLYNKYDFFRKQRLKVIVTGRGCPYNCAFCFNKGLKKMYSGRGKYVRKRSVENVINEIKQLRKQDPYMKRIIFEDDALNHDKDWIIRFCKIYSKEIKIPFSCALRADKMNSEIAKALKMAGCFTAKIGIESANEHIRNQILKKQLSNQEIVTAAKAIKQQKIKLKTYNLIGSPNETLEDVFNTIKFNIRINTDFAHAHILQPYPKTEIAKYVIENNLIESHFDINAFERGFFISNWVKLKNKKEIMNLHKFFSLCVSMPIIIPLVKMLIRLPFGRIYHEIFKLSYFLFSLKYEEFGLKDGLTLALNTRKYFKK